MTPERRAEIEAKRYDLGAYFATDDLVAELLSALDAAVLAEKWMRDKRDEAEKKAKVARNLPRLVEMLDTIGSWSDVHDAAQALLDAHPEFGLVGDRTAKALQFALDLERREVSGFT